MTFNKTHFKYFIYGITVSLFTVVLINYIIDPFQIYRKATFHKTIFMKGFYLNAGLIKNYDYDSVSIGSSMTQNFKIEDLKKQLSYKKPIKLPISGGSIVEHFTVLQSAISTNKVKNVLFGIDIFSLNNNDNRLPKYLYDDNILNDYKYLFSIDTLKRSFTYPFLHFSITENHPKLDYNLMFQWQQNYSKSDFSAIKVLNSYKSKKVNLNNNISSNEITKERLENFDKYILKIIRENPNIDFTFFYPPYSILTYKLMTYENLNSFIDVKKYINKKLLELSNAKIYDFQEEYEIITELNNYKDVTHYHQRINLWMLKHMQKNKELITSDKKDYKKFIEKITEYEL